MVAINYAKNKSEQKIPENYWITVLLYFASFLVGLGIVAEVAANWQCIPNAVKLSGAVLLMVTNAFLLIWCDKNNKHLLKQVVAVIFAFLIMGTIGLIGQVFQLESDFANGCLLWSVAAWPLIIFVPRLLWLWLPLFYIGMRFYNVIFGDIISFIIGDNFGDETRRIFLSNLPDAVRICAFTVFYGIFIVYEFIMNSQYKNNVAALKPLRFYLGLSLLGVYSATVEVVRLVPPVAGNLHHYVYFFTPYLVLAAVIYLYNRLKNRVSFMPLFLLGIVFEALIAIQTKSKNFFMPDTEVFLPIIFLLIMTAYAFYHKRPILKIISVVFLIFWLIFTFESNLFDIIPSLILCAAFAFFSYNVRSRKAFNCSVILAVLRILIYYADVDNLEYVGIYLIGSGLLMIATILALFKYGNMLWREKDEK